MTWHKQFQKPPLIPVGALNHVFSTRGVWNRRLVPLLCQWFPTIVAPSNQFETPPTYLAVLGCLAWLFFQPPHPNWPLGWQSSAVRENQNPPTLQNKMAMNFCVWRDGMHRSMVSLWPEIPMQIWDCRFSLSKYGQSTIFALRNRTKTTTAGALFAKPSPTFYYRPF